MSWYSKVYWAEGLFLRPHHLQQQDRYVEHLVGGLTRQVTPYPWGFTALEIDRDLAQQSKFAVRRATGIMPDGTPFAIPDDSPIPEPIDIAHPRLSFELRRTAKPGYISLGIARVLEVRDRNILFDEKYVPPMLTCAAHPTIDGWINRIIGWIDNKLEELSRYAVDPSSGGGLQSVDYFVLQLLNREIPALKHFQRSAYVHPERLYDELLRLAGELATFATSERRAREYPAYNHDDLENVFAPLIRDIQDFLSAPLGRRAIRLQLIERAQNAFISPIRDRSLFRNATLVLEVAARRPLIDIQNQFPHLFKVGPNTKMNEIVHAHLPGVTLVHLPTPPRHIRAITDHVYFYLDRKSPLWPEFSTAGSIGMHFSGDWPDLELELWAVLEDRR